MDASSARPSRLAYAALLGMVLSASAVYWVWSALPYQDLPGHAGLIALRQRIGNSAFDQANFVHVPRLGPYSVFRMLGALFARVLGPLGSVRLLATLPVLALPASMLAARKLIHGETHVAQGYLAILLSFGFMTISGFASYNLAIAVFLLAVSAHIALLERGEKDADRRGLPVLIAALSVALYFCHGFAFGLAGLAAFGASLPGGRLRPLARAKSLLLWTPGALIAACVSYTERYTKLPGGAVQPSTPSMPYYDGFLGKLSLLATPTLMTRTGVDVALGIVLWLALAVALLRARRTTLAGTTRRCLSAAALLFCVFCILPHGIGWFGFVDGRVAPLLLLLPIVGLKDAAWPRHFLKFGAPALAAAMVGLIHVGSFYFQNEALGSSAVIAAVPARARLLSLMVNPDSKFFTASPFTHYDKLVLADRECVPSAMWFHQGTAIYPTKNNAALRLPTSYHEADIGHVDWAQFHLEDWDYVLIRQLPEQGEPQVPGSFTRVIQRGSFWLFSVRKP